MTECMFGNFSAFPISNNVSKAYLLRSKGTFDDKIRKNYMAVMFDDETDLKDGGSFKTICTITIIRKEKISLPLIPILNEGEKIPLLYKSLNVGLMSRLSRGELVLPNFNDSETVAIFTDNGGEAKDSKYFTYTITLVGYNQLAFFDDNMKNIREKYRLNNPIKEIAFKDLKYGPIKRSLDEYFNVINNSVNGIVFTLVVDKEIHSLAEINEKHSKKLVAKTLEERGFGTFKADVAEKIYRIINLISYLVHLLVPYGKKYFGCPIKIQQLKQKKCIRKLQNFLIPLSIVLMMPNMTL